MSDDNWNLLTAPCGNMLIIDHMALIYHTVVIATLYFVNYNQLLLTRPRGMNSIVYSIVIQLTFSYCTVKFIRVRCISPF